MSGLRSFFLVLVALVVVLSVASQASGRVLRAQDALKHLGADIPLLYQGGPVVNNPISFYFFFYGNFSDPTGPDFFTPGLVQQFLTDISGTSYLNIAAQYTDKHHNNVTTQVSYAGATFVTGYPDGHVLQTDTTNCFEVLIKKYIKNFNVPLSNNTQYYILYSSDVTYVTDAGPCESGSIACGYHTNYFNDTTQEVILWGQISSNSEDCDGFDGPYSTASNVALSVLSHELFETITDPQIDAWLDANGDEIGDKCAYMYGVEFDSTFTPGKVYNLKLNGHEYLVQTEWDNSILNCSISRGSVVAASPSGSPSAPAAGVTPTPSASVVNLPSPQPSASHGASASATATTVVSPSAAATRSAAPSLNRTAGGCFNCPTPKCGRVRQVSRVCTKTLKGNFSAVNGVACCSNIAASATVAFHWTVDLVPTCDYSIPYTKQAALCKSLGGTVSCTSAANGGVRLDCSR